MKTKRFLLKKALSIFLVTGMVVGSFGGNISVVHAEDTSVSGGIYESVAIRTVGFNTAAEWLLGNNNASGASGHDVLVAGNQDGWSIPLSYTDIDGGTMTLSNLNGSVFGTARNSVVTFEIPRELPAENIESVELDLTIRNVQQIAAGARMGVYGNSLTHPWNETSDKTIFGANGTASGLDQLDLLGFTDAITVGTTSTTPVDSGQTVSLKSKLLTEYVRGVVNDPAYEEGELSFRLAGQSRVGGIRVYSEYASLEQQPKLRIKYLEKPQPSQIEAVRTVGFSSGTEFLMGNESGSSEWSGKDLLIAGSASNTWSIANGTTFTDSDGTETAMPTVTGTAFGSPRNAVVTFKIPEGQSAEDIKTVELDLTIRNVKQIAPGARLAVYGNSLTQSWNKQSSKTVFGASSESGLDQLELLGFTEPITAGNGTANTTTVSGQTISLRSNKLIEYVKNIVDQSGYNELSFRLAGPEVGGIRVYSEYATSAPTLRFTYSDETLENVPVTIKTIDEEGNTLIPDSTVQVQEGEEYTYSGEPAQIIQDDNGVFYQYNPEASVLSLTVTKGIDNEIKLVYSRQGEAAPFSGNTVTEEGAWCWFADPRALHYENQDGSIDMTYIGYIDVHGAIKATQYNHNTKETEEVLIRSNFQPDDHNNPTFLILPDGRVMVFYSRHTDEKCFYYRVSKEAGDITTFGKEHRLVTTHNTTYPSPFILSDDPDHIYLTWRGINWHPTLAKLSMPNENDEVQFVWGPKQVVSSSVGGSVRPYAKYVSDGKSKIHMTYTATHPDNIHPNPIYYSYIDVTDMTLRDRKGNRLSNIGNAPFAINGNETDANFVVNDRNTSGRGWVWEIALDNNVPVIALVKISNDKLSHDYYYAKWNGTSWTKTFLTNAGGKFHPSNTEYCYSGGMSLDKGNPKIIYASVPVEGSHGKVYEIIKYEMSADGQQIVKTTQITRDSVKNNVRPFVVKNAHEDEFRLLWLNGDYYYWIVGKSYPNGYPTSVRTDFDIPKPNDVDTTSGMFIGYDFKTTEGSTVEDSKGNYNASLLGDATVKEGVLELSGSSDGIQINGDVFADNAMKSFTISMYADISERNYLSGHNLKLFDFADGAFSLYVKDIASTDSMSLPGRLPVLTTAGEGGSTEITSTNMLSNSDWNKDQTGGTSGAKSVTNMGWTHFAITYDADTGRTKTYVNGLVDTSGLSMKDMLDSIGGGSYTIGGFYGQMADIRVYSRALGQYEVKEVMDEIQDLPKGAIFPYLSTANWATVDLGAGNTESQTMEFVVKPLETKQDGAIFYTGQAATLSDWGHAPIVIRLNTNGYFDARNGGAYTATNQIAYEANQEYEVKVTVDVPAKKYSVYINGQILALDFAFRTGAQTITDIGKLCARGGASAAAGKFMIMNHKIGKPEGVQTRTVTFDANGGSVNPASMTAEVGKTLSLPTPTRADYRFTGWYTEAIGGTPVTNQTIIQEDMTLYAQWTEIAGSVWEPYPSTANWNSVDLGSGHTGNQTIEFVVTPLEAKQDGSIFFTGQNTLLSDWGHAPIAIRFYTNGYFEARNGGSYMATNQIAYEANESYTVTVDIDLENKKYNVYVTGSDGEKQLLAAGFDFRTGAQQITDIGKVCARGGAGVAEGKFVIEDLTIQAGSELEVFHTVTFNANGGSVSPDNMLIPSGGTLDLPIPTRSHHEFKGWFTASTGGNPVTNETTFKQDTTIYAHWEIQTYTITLDAHGGEVTPAIMTVESGKTLSLPTPTRDGYRFKGWFTEGTGGTQVTNQTVFTQSMVLYARWEDIYTIVLDANGGKVTPASMTVESGQTLSLPTPMRDGYSFEGWFTEATGGTQVTNQTVFSRSITLYARWVMQKAVVHTVIFDANGGKVAVTSMVVESGKTLKLPIANFGGYKFNGWFTAKTGGEKVTDGTAIHRDMTVYAQWTRDSLRIGEGFTADSFKYKVIKAGQVELLGFATSSKVKSVVIPATITAPSTIETYKVVSIAPNAFSNNKAITAVTIGKNVTTIEKSAFAKCTALKTVKGAKAVKAIENNAFMGCKKLTNVSTMGKLVKIGESAFKGCSAIKKFTIGKSVTSIGKKAFYKCKRLSKIIIKSAKLKKVGNKAIAGIRKNAVLKVPSKKMSKYRKYFNAKTGYKKTMRIMK